MAAWHSDRWLLSGMTLAPLCVIGTGFLLGRPQVNVQTLPRISSVSPAVSPEDCLRDVEQDSSGSQRRAVCLWSSLTATGSPGWKDWTLEPAAGMSAFQCPLGPDGAEQTASLPAKASMLGALMPLQADDSHAADAEDIGGQLSAVSFNKAAVALICDSVAPSSKTSNLLERLNERANASNPDAAVGTASPEGSYPMVVKTIWAQVPNPAGKVKVPLWNGTKPPDNNWHFSHWAYQASPTEESVCDYAGSSGPPPSVNCFAKVDLAPDEVKDAYKRHRVNTAVTQAGSRGSHFLLLAVNIAVKKGSQWLWQTYNWDARTFPQPLPQTLAASGATPVHGVWAHYVAKTDTSDADTSYSPYLEARVQNPSPDHTDCAGCHRAAAFHQSEVPGLAKDIFNCTNGGYCANPASVTTPTRHFDTDFLWTLAAANVQSFGTP